MFLWAEESDLVSREGCAAIEVQYHASLSRFYASITQITLIISVAPKNLDTCSEFASTAPQASWPNDLSLYGRHSIPDFG